jgi:hypothetical protein
MTDNASPKWLLPTVIVIGLLTLAALIMAAISLTDNSTVSNGGTGGSNGKNGSNGSAGPRGPPGSNGTNGTNGTDGANGVLITQSMWLGFSATNANVPPLTGVLPPPIGFPLLTPVKFDTDPLISGARPNGSIIPVQFGNGFYQQLQCSVTGQYLLTATWVMQGGPGAGGAWNALWCIIPDNLFTRSDLINTPWFAEWLFATSGIVGPNVLYMENVQQSVFLQQGDKINVAYYTDGTLGTASNVNLTITLLTTS